MANAKDDPIARFVLARILSQTAAHSHLRWDTLVDGEHACLPACLPQLPVGVASCLPACLPAGGGGGGGGEAPMPHYAASLPCPAGMCPLHLPLSPHLPRRAPANLQARRYRTAPTCTASPASSCGRWPA